MNAWEIILGIVMILVSVVIVGVILLQQGRRSGVNGVISGAADTFLSKNKANTVSAKLASITKYVAIAFFVVSLIAYIVAIVK